MIRSILIIDDVPELLEFTRDVLAEAGYAVHTAGGGREALEFLLSRDAHQLPDLILADLMMPDINGWQFLNALRRHPAWEAIPVIITTAYPRHAVGISGVRLLQRPFTVDALLASVEGALGSRPDNTTRIA
jgi:CheY-like chemotaxis protein